MFKLSAQNDGGIQKDTLRTAMTTFNFTQPNELKKLKYRAVRFELIPVMATTFHQP